MPQNAKLQSRHLLGLQQVPAEDIQLILQWAGHFKEVINRPIKRVPSLRDLTVANLFFENSTRTRLSFELAEKRLSADVVNFSASTSSVKKGETLNDTVSNILAMKVDLVVIRHSEAGVAHFLADRVPAHIVNAGDGTHEHPTQALLDAFTMQERIGSLEGKKVVIVGDILHSRVALSNIFGLQKLGVHVAVTGPSTLIPRAISELGVEVIDSLDDALEWADVANVLRVQHERMDRAFFPSIREYHKRYGITMDRLNRLKQVPLILHPGPINRGVELTSEVADSPYAAILNQVENGVAVRMAVLYLLASQSAPQNVV